VRINRKFPGNSRLTDRFLESQQDSALSWVDVAAQDENGMTSLHLAAMNGHDKVVEMLVAAGAAVDAEDRYRKPPLYFAAMGGHNTVVKILLEAGADMFA
jgi:ankyrin repeat protein